MCVSDISSLIFHLVCLLLHVSIEPVYNLHQKIQRAKSRFRAVSLPWVSYKFIHLKEKNLPYTKDIKTTSGGMIRRELIKISGKIDRFQRKLPTVISNGNQDPYL